ncbi:MAG: hypothetical protein KGL39_10530 [Patescibacteria group bacterium]|nr:hypothetical protein [Patescibacteria group bacterium]
MATRRNPKESATAPRGARTTPGYHGGDSGDEKLSQVFDIIATYFVDVVANHVYQHARATSGNAPEKFADAYREALHSYAIGVKSDKEMNRSTLDNLHKYYANFYKGEAYAQFVDGVVRHFVPREYFEVMTAENKDDTLNYAVCALVSELATYVTSPEGVAAARAGPRAIQDRGVAILRTKRDELFNRCMKRDTGATGLVSGDIVDRMKGAMRKLAKEKIAAQARAMELAAALEAARVREKKLVRLVKILRAPNRAAALIQHAARPEDTIAEPADDPLDVAAPREDTIAERPKPSEDSDQRPKKQSAKPAEYSAPPKKNTAKPAKRDAAPEKKQEPATETKRPAPRLDAVPATTTLAAEIVDDEEDEESDGEGEEEEEEDTGGELTL